MNKRIISLILASMPFMAFAQTAVEAASLSQSDFRGTARFMSMAGAFTALGGDVSTLTQNPGGIGLFRKSEIGLTLDIDIQSTQATTPSMQSSLNQTNAYFNNISYVGSAIFGSERNYSFNWGFSYGRKVSFDRKFKGQSTMNGSLSEYIAGYSTDERYLSSDLSGIDNNNNNNYFYGYCPWLAMLAYNGFVINNKNGYTDRYFGLYEDGITKGLSTFNVVEQGYVDEYSLNFGGNVTNLLYWGLGIGITDIDFSNNTYYTEDMTDARNPILDGNNVVAGNPGGDGGFGLDSYTRITGNGVNVKFGVILRPINELRIGLAVHTPTYYKLEKASGAAIDYGYPGVDLGYDVNGEKIPNPGIVSTPDDYRKWKLSSPWRLMLGVAGVIGNNAIISADYEYRAYNNMSISSFDDYSYSYEDYSYGNEDIKNYYQSSNILRIGAEYRVTPKFSVRAGYSYETSPTKAIMSNIATSPMVYTSNPVDTGTTPSYTLNKDTQMVTLGLGYRFGAFSIDAAYVYRNRKSDFMAFTPNNYTTPYSAQISDTHNNIVLSMGFKF